MAVSQNRIALGGLARKLVAEGLLDEQKATDAYEDAKNNKVPFVKYLVDNDLQSSKVIAHAASTEFGVPLLDIDALELDADVLKLVSEELIQKHHALPIFKRGNRVYIAVADPTNLQALDEIKFHIGANTEALVVEQDKLAKAIDKALEEADGGLGDMDDSSFDDLDDLEVGDDQPDDHDDSDIDDARLFVSLIKYCSMPLKKALQTYTSSLTKKPIGYAFESTAC